MEEATEEYEGRHRKPECDHDWVAGWHHKYGYHVVCGICGARG